GPVVGGTPWPGRLAGRRVRKALSGRPPPGTAPATASHLDIVAVVGGDEVGTHQQEDDTGGVEVLVNLPLPLARHGDIAVAPTPDDPLPFEDAKVLQQLPEERLVLVGVGEEDSTRPVGIGEAAIGGNSL